MAEKMIIRSERSPNQNFDLLEPRDGTAEIYVDGFAGMIFSVSTVKLDLYSAIGANIENDTTIEQRELKLRLVLPTNNFLDMCVKGLETMAGNQEAVNKATQNYVNQLRQYLTVVTPSEPKKET